MYNKTKKIKLETKSVHQKLIYSSWNSHATSSIVFLNMPKILHLLNGFQSEV